MAANGRWLVVVGLLVGLITGGLGSAAIGHVQYKDMEGRFLAFVHERHQEDMFVRDMLSEDRQRLASIEAKVEANLVILRDIQARLSRSPTGKEN